MNIEKLNEQLRTGVVTITFTKVSGEERTMNATLMEGKIPITENKTGKKRTPNEEILVVVDVDKNEWRSLRKDSIKSVEIANV